MNDGNWRFIGVLRVEHGVSRNCTSVGSMSVASVLAAVFGFLTVVRRAAFPHTPRVSCRSNVWRPERYGRLWVSALMLCVVSIPCRKISSISPLFQVTPDVPEFAVSVQEFRWSDDGGTRLKRFRWPQWEWEFRAG